jgi:hypothetical protein
VNNILGNSYAPEGKLVFGLELVPYGAIMTIDDVIDRANAIAAETFKRWVSLRTLEDARNLVKMPPLPPDQFDEVISSIIEDFRTSDPASRKAISSRLNRYSQKRLLGYATGMAELAVRRQSPDLVSEGLIALVIEGGREDIRDSVSCLAALYNSAVKLQLDAAKTFADVASLGEPGALQLGMSRFPFRPPKDRGLAAFYLREINTEDGFSYEHVPPWLKE